MPTEVVLEQKEHQLASLPSWDGSRASELHENDIIGHRAAIARPAYPQNNSATRFLPQLSFWAEFFATAAFFCIGSNLGSTRYTWPDPDTYESSLRASNGFRLFFAGHQQEDRGCRRADANRH